MISSYLVCMDVNSFLIIIVFLFYPLAFSLLFLSLYASVPQISSVMSSRQVEIEKKKRENVGGVCMMVICLDCMKLFS